MQRLLYFLLFPFLAQSLEAQAFLQRYESATNDTIYMVDIAPNADGGVFALATIGQQSIFDSVQSAVVLRLAGDGAFEWSKSYQTEAMSIVNDLQPTQDGGFLVVGSVDFAEDAYVFKADANGNVLWTRRIGDGERQILYEVLPTADGGYVLAGAYDNFPKYELFLTKLDNAGNELWSRRYNIDDEVDQYSFSLVELPNQHIVACGYTLELGKIADTFVTEVNAGGAMLWYKIYTYEAYVNQGISIAQLSSGNLVLLQSIRWAPNLWEDGPQGLMISKLDGVGEELWSKSLLLDEDPIITNIDGLNYELSALPHKVLVTPEDDILISTRVEDTGLDAIRPAMIKMDNDGNVIWGKLLAEPNFLHVPYFACRDDNLSITSDNHYALVFQGLEDRTAINVAKVDPNATALCLESFTPDFLPVSMEVQPIKYGVVTMTTIGDVSTTVGDLLFTTEQLAAEPFDVDLGPDTLLCPGESLLLNANLGDEYSYNWQDGSNLPTLEVSTAGAYIVTVSQGACGVSDTIMILDFATTLDLGEDQTLCDGETIRLMPLEVANGFYLWNDGTEGPILEATQPGEYILSLTNPFCGTIQDTVMVSPTPAIILEITGPDFACAGETVSLTAGNPNPNLEYSWVDADGIPLSQTATYSFTATQSLDISIFATDGCGTATEEVAFPVYTTIADAEPVGTTCGLPNGQLTLTQLGGTAPYSVQWTDAQGTIVATGEAALDSLAAGTYSLLVTDNLGCTYMDDYLVAPSEGLAVEVNIQDPNCLAPGGELIATAIGGLAPFNYSLDGGPVQTTGVFSDLSAGAYLLEVWDAQACDTMLELNLAEAIIPQLTLTASTTDLSLGDSTALMALTNLLSEDITVITWLPTDGLSCADCLNPTASPTADITYTLSLINTDGCTATATISLTVDTAVELYIPNIFSPNNDGNNDFFRVYPGKGVAEIESVQVFDRWGGLVYEAANNEGWDGRAGKDPAAPGVYVYQVGVRLFDGTIRIESGDITLIR